MKKSFPLSTIHYPLSTKIRKSKQHVVILGLFIVAFLAFAYSVSAAGLVPCGNTPDDLCTTCDFFQLFDNVKNFLLFKIVPPVGVLFVVIAGFFILTAGAKSDHYARGKKILTDLVWGLLIIFGAWMLTNTVIKLLASESDISGSWYKIECSATSGINPGGGRTFSCASNPATLSVSQKTATFTVSGGTAPITCTWPDIGSTGTYTSKNGCSATVSFPDEKATVTINAQVTDSSDPVKSGTAACKVKGVAVVPPPGGSVVCSNPSSTAAKYGVPYPRQNAPELTTLIGCIRGRLPGQNLGSQYTFDNSHPICNYTRGNRVCGSCSHAVNSCHYGGLTGNQGALAVDFGNEAIGNQIIQAALACGAKSARCENARGKTVNCVGGGANHIHVNSASCDKN